VWGSLLLIRRQDQRPTCRISSTPEAPSLPNSGLLF